MIEKKEEKKGTVNKKFPSVFFARKIPTNLPFFKEMLKAMWEALMKDLTTYQTNENSIINTPLQDIGIKLISLSRRIAFLCTFIAFLPSLMPSHRIVCLRMAVLKNMECGNFGTAAVLIQVSGKIVAEKKWKNFFICVSEINAGRFFTQNKCPIVPN